MKRYGGEGAESAMGFYDEFFKLAANGKDVLLYVLLHRLVLYLQCCFVSVIPNEP